MVKKTNVDQILSNTNIDFFSHKYAASKDLKGLNIKSYTLNIGFMDQQTQIFHKLLPFLKLISVFGNCFPFLFNSKSFSTIPKISRSLLHFVCLNDPPICFRVRK